MNYDVIPVFTVLSGSFRYEQRSADAFLHLLQSSLGGLHDNREYLGLLGRIDEAKGLLPPGGRRNSFVGDWGSGFGGVAFGCPFLS